MQNSFVEIVNFKTTKDYEKNLKEVIKIIKNSPSSFLLFPEVSLTGFDYENWEKANEFGKIAVKELSKINKAFGLTIIEDNKNCFYFFDNGVIHKRAKYNLFGYEKRYFNIGSRPDIFEWRGLRVGNLICFELRFIEYWEKFRGVDIILVPARWGAERIEHFKTLNKALALSTQSQVIAVNSANEKAWGCSFDAWGEGGEAKRGIFGFDLGFNKRVRKKIDLGM